MTHLRYKFGGFPWSLISFSGPEAQPLTTSAACFLDSELPVQADLWQQARNKHSPWKKLIMNYKLAQSCLKRNISPLLSRQKQAWFHVKFCLLKPRKFYRTEHHNEMRKSNLDLLSIHLNIRLVICCPGPEWHIFHLLTSEDIDDIIS